MKNLTAQEAIERKANSLLKYLTLKLIVYKNQKGGTEEQSFSGTNINEYL